VIASLRGRLLEKRRDEAVIEVSGVGYSVAVAGSTAERLPNVGDDLLLFTAESVAMYGGGTSLYGFLTAEEKQVFNVIRDNVPGTGAKKALEFLDKAAKSLPDFRRAVLEKDAKALVSLFGFTAKTAEKLVAGLDGKIEPASVSGAERGKTARGRPSSIEDAIAGLVSLGYRDAAARDAVQLAAGGTPGQAATSESLIRDALRYLSGQR
jgi:Holliday junction DNA helicase RuvA